MNKEGISHIPRFKPKIRTRIDESNHKSTKQTTNRHYRGLHRTRPKPQCPHGLACAATCPHGPPSNRASGNRTTEQRQHLKGTRRRPTFLDVTGEALTTSRPFHLHPQARRRATPQPHGPCANGEQRGWLLCGRRRRAQQKPLPLSVTNLEWERRNRRKEWRRKSHRGEVVRLDCENQNGFQLQ